MAAYVRAAPPVPQPPAMAAGPSSLKDFEVVQALGKGSYGSVHKAKRKADGLEYAIKEVNIRKLNPREREDALNEIRILASIRHKNIIRYCDAFVERDNLYIVMEFAEHGDIGRQIEKFKKANKYIKEDNIWSYAIQIAQGLLSLHDKNVLHRDIKPKNVFLTGKAHVRLGDLGCAKLMKGGLARTQIGTPYYMSPEIWSNRSYDAKSDMWALGCLLFELAQFEPPFLADDMAGLSNAVRSAAPKRISRHYSDDLAGIVSLLLDKDPRRRPSAREFLSLPAVANRMHMAPADEESAWAGDEPQRAALIATIKVPYGFGVPGMYGGAAGGYGALNMPGYGPRLNLPAPCYPSRPSSRPASPSRAEDREAAKDGSNSVNTSVASSAGAAAPPAAAASNAGSNNSGLPQPQVLGRDGALVPIVISSSSASGSHNGNGRPGPSPTEQQAQARPRTGSSGAANPAPVAGSIGVTSEAPSSAPASGAAPPLARKPSSGAISSSAGAGGAPAPSLLPPSLGIARPIALPAGSPPPPSAAAAPPSSSAGVGGVQRSLAVPPINAAGAGFGLNLGLPQPAAVVLGGGTGKGAPSSAGAGAGYQPIAARLGLGLNGGGGYGLAPSSYNAGNIGASNAAAGAGGVKGLISGLGGLRLGGGGLPTVPECKPMGAAQQQPVMLAPRRQVSVAGLVSAASGAPRPGGAAAGAAAVAGFPPSHNNGLIGGGGGGVGAAGAYLGLGARGVPAAQQQPVARQW